MSQTAAAAREPLLRIAKREGTTMPQKIAVRAIEIGRASCRERV